MFSEEERREVESLIHEYSEAWRSVRPTIDKFGKCRKKLFYGYKLSSMLQFLLLHVEYNFTNN